MRPEKFVGPFDTHCLQKNSQDLRRNLENHAGVIEDAALGQSAQRQIDSEAALTDVAGMLAAKRRQSVFVGELRVLPDLVEHVAAQDDAANRIEDLVERFHVSGGAQPRQIALDDHDRAQEPRIGRQTDRHIQAGLVSSAHA